MNDSHPMLLKLADLCARSEQCEFDLRRKMVRAELDATEMDAIIARLREGRFIDDRRYARAFASHKSRLDGWGPAKIRQALAAKRIDRDSIAEALESVDTQVYASALQHAAERRARSLDLTDRKDRDKLVRHLAAKGFSLSDILRTIDALRNR